MSALDIDRPDISRKKSKVEPFLIAGPKISEEQTPRFIPEAIEFLAPSLLQELERLIFKC